MDPAVFIQDIKVNQVKLRYTADTTRIIKICFLKMQDAFLHQIADLQKDKHTDDNSNKNNSVKTAELVVFYLVRDKNITQQNTKNLRD